MCVSLHFTFSILCDLAVIDFSLEQFQSHVNVIKVLLIILQSSEGSLLARKVCLLKMEGQAKVKLFLHKMVL